MHTRTRADARSPKVLFDPQLLPIFSLTLGVGTAMVWLGARMNMLELRNPERRCPSCGVRVRQGQPCRCAR